MKNLRENLLIKSFLLKVVFLILLIKIKADTHSQFNVLLKNMQDHCVFCLIAKANDVFAFTQCPNIFDQSSRFTLRKTVNPYIFLIESLYSTLTYDGNEEFYLFPIFNSKQALISSTTKRMCLNNDLNSNTVFPYETSFQNIFAPCDYSGSTISQIFIVEEADITETHKYIVKLYNSGNPANPQKDTLLSQADVNSLISKGFKIYFSYIDVNNRSLEFTFSTNTFTAYLPTTPTSNESYMVNSNDTDFSPNFCSYTIYYRNITGNLKIPFFNSNRCVINTEIHLNIDNLNLVTFKIKNQTKNIYIQSSAILIGSNINFLNTSYSSSYAPFTYTNSSSVSSFQKLLDFGNYDIGVTDLTVSSLKWKYLGFSFTINSCNYYEIDIPIYENTFSITFEIWNKTTNTIADSSIILVNSNIQMTGDDVYQKLNNSTFSSFPLTIIYGIYTINLTVANSTTHSYTPIQFTADMNKTVKIEIVELHPPLPPVAGNPCINSACDPGNFCTSNMCFEECFAKDSCTDAAAVPRMNTYFCDYSSCTPLPTAGNACSKSTCASGNWCDTGSNMCFEVCVQTGNCSHQDQVPRINTYFCDSSWCNNPACGGTQVKIIDRLHNKCIKTRQPYNGYPAFDTCDDTKYSMWTLKYTMSGIQFTICNFQNDCLRRNSGSPDNRIYLSSSNGHSWGLIFWPPDSKYYTIQEEAYNYTIIAGTIFDGNVYHQPKDERNEGKWRFDPPCIP